MATPTNSKAKRLLCPQSAPQLSKNELDRITEVFKIYETGLREATIYPKDLAVAMKKLGLNPTETEIQDLINEVERNGFIYYPAFCRVVMRKLREDDEENFRQELFRTLVGAKPYSDGIPAKLYNINAEYLTFEQFKTIMTNLPEYVDEDEVKTMFGCADKDGNGRINYKEFTLMCNVPKQEVIPMTLPETTTTEIAKTSVSGLNGNPVGASVSAPTQTVDTVVTVMTSAPATAT